MKKKIVLGILSLWLFAIMSIALTSAEFWACFNRGEKIDFCNPKTPDRTAPNDGYLICMSSYNESKQCYNNAGWNSCNTLTPPEECGGIGRNTTIDTEPPELTINSPLQNSIHTSKSVLLNFQLNEKSDVYYIDNINGRGRWIKVCQECLSYSGKRNFNEGASDLTFKSVDVVGNTAYKNLSFFIDSKKPKIKKTIPKNGFIASPFEVQFSEENPSSLILYYGNLLIGYREKELDLENDCYIDRGRYYCNAEVPLKDYDGQQIEYWFVLKDIANNTAESKHIWLEVDTIFPVLNNPDSFWQQGEGKNDKYIYFTFNITEKNFDFVSYIDNSSTRPRERALCSRLRNGICEKKVSFTKGSHNIDVQIIDKAGNSIGVSTGEFDVEY